MVITLGGRLDRLTPAALTPAAEFAVRTAALTCQSVGADPPWAHRQGRADLRENHPPAEVRP